MVEKKPVSNGAQGSWAWMGLGTFIIIFIIVLLILWCLQPCWVMKRSYCGQKKCDDKCDDDCDEDRCCDTKQNRCVCPMKLFLYSLIIAIIVSIIIGVIYGAGYAAGRSPRAL